MERQRRTFASAPADRRAFPSGGACIYTGRPLSVPLGPIDHFVPWSFVAHDAIWNLVLLEGSLNSRKAHRLPERRFVSRLAAFHAGVIDHLRRDASGRDRSLEEYALGLRLPPDALARGRELAEAYAIVMDPIFTVARSMGFPGDWSP